MNYRDLIKQPSLFPSMVVVSVNNFCNYECVHCYYPKYSRKPGYHQQFLSAEIFEKIAQEMGQYPASSLRLIAWGEPLLHPKLESFVRIMQQRAPSSKVTLITNGSLLTEDRAIKLMQAGLDMIEISVDAVSNENYNRTRSSNIRDALGKVERNTRAMIALRDKHHFKTRIVLSFILWPDDSSKREFKLFQKKWKPLADAIAKRPLHSFMGSVEVPADKLKQGSIERQPCYSLWARCHVNPWGEISVCYNDWDRRNNLASLENRDVSLRQVWQGFTLMQLRTGQTQGQFNGCCKNCMDYNPDAWNNPYENLLNRVMCPEQSSK